MQVLEILEKAQGGHAIDNLARAYGIEPQAAQAAVAAIVPEVARSIERNTFSRGGLADMVSALGIATRSGVLDNPASLASPAVQAQGIAFLDQIFGSKDKSRAVAHRAAAASGLGEALIKQMLPVIISMIIGALAKGSGGALGDVISKIPGLGGDQQAGRPRQTRRRETDDMQIPPLPESTGGGPFSLPGGHSGGGGLDGGGRMGDGSGGSMRGGGDSPLPLPGDNIPGLGGPSGPYGDLSDIIRKGGPAVAAGGGLFAIVRSILGTLLGFQSRGVMGWLVRLVVMRWGWGLLRTILGRLVMRR